MANHSYFSIDIL